MAIFLKSAWSNEPFAGYANSVKFYGLNARTQPLIHFQSCPFVSCLTFCNVLITNMSRWKGQSKAVAGMIPHSAIGLEGPGRRIGGVTLKSSFRVRFVWISFQKLRSILIQNSLQLFTQDLLPSTITCVMETAKSIIILRHTPKFLSCCSRPV